MARNAATADSRLGIGDFLATFDYQHRRIDRVRPTSWRNRYVLGACLGPIVHCAATIFTVVLIQRGSTYETVGGLLQDILAIPLFSLAYRLPSYASAHFWGGGFSLGLEAANGVLWGLGAVSILHIVVRVRRQPDDEPLDEKYPAQRLRQSHFSSGRIALILAVIAAGVAVVVGMASSRGQITPATTNAALDSMMLLSLAAMSFGIAGLYEERCWACAMMGAFIALLDLVFIPSLLVA